MIEVINKSNLDELIPLIIEHCWKFARKNGALRLQWSIAPTNQQAQRLYDSLAVSKSAWLFYTYTA